jgi:glutamate carboxypeptidase
MIVLRFSIGYGMRALLLMLPFLILVPNAGGQQLTETEQRIVVAVDAHHDEALDLLERTVNMNSGTMNFEGVREVGGVFRQEFDELGFETRWIDGEAWGRAGHLIAERAGEGPRIVLIGHLDTVFELDSPFQSFEMLDDSTARGPGVIDMKGGNVIILKALTALRDVEALDDLHVTVLLIGDEEKSGNPLSLAREALIEAAKAADVAIGFEDGDGNPRTAVIARRGWTGWTLTTSGRPAHSSQIFQPEIGTGAAYELARILYRFYEELSDEEYLTFNPGTLLAGTDIDFDPSQDRGTAFGKSNVIAENAMASGDLRTIDAAQLERAKERMEAIVAENLPHTSAEITFDDSYPPMGPRDGNRRLLALYDQVSRDLDLGSVEAVNPQNAGAADISFTADHVEMAIDGLGLMGTAGHTVEETADLRTLPSQTKRAALLLYRLAQGQ